MVKAHPPYSKRMCLFMQRKDSLGRKRVALCVICATFISIGLVGWCEPQEDINWCDVSSSWTMPTESKLTFVDLFCGAGGLSKGLEFAGLKGVCGLDYFVAAERTYRRNFEHRYLNGDVTIPEVKSNLYRIVRERIQGESIYDNYSEAWRRCMWNQPSPTVKENHGGVMVHPILPRVLTVRELARLQSFPDDFIFEGNKSQQLI